MRKTKKKKPIKVEPLNFPKKENIVIKSKLKPKTKNQENFIISLAENVITLAIGPAGTGKTRVSVAYGIEKLIAGEYKRLVLTRPIVEAGESLGYLPGDFSEKINPYLQPIYYELQQYLSKQQLQTFINNGMNNRGSEEIIIAPLAYMRGLNFHDAYMILDEAQNCTYEQIKLFITRVGFNSKAVLVGDNTQSDLPNGKSGLATWYDHLNGIKNVSTIKLEKEDIIRNPVIADILNKVSL